VNYGLERIGWLKVFHGNYRVTAGDVIVVAQDKRAVHITQFQDRIG
jgi:hypothetical protein